MLLLAACSVGPDYEPSDLSHRTDPPFAAAAAAAAATELAELDTWWLEFGDPALSALMESLPRTNLDLAVARQRLAEARARLGRERTATLPTVAARGAYERIGAGKDSLTIGGAPPGARTDLFSASAIAGWEIDLWGRAGRLVEGATAEMEASAFDVQAAFVSLSAELALTWFELAVLDARIDVVGRATALQETALDLARSTLTAGSGTRLDVAQAERALAETRARLPRLQRARAAATGALSVLLGRREVAPDLASVPGSSGQRALPDLPPIPRLGQPADLLLRRADLRASERRLHAAVAAIGAAEAERYPTISLSGTFALQNRTASGLFEDSLVYRLGPSLSWPVFDGGRIDANVAVHEARAEGARVAFERDLLAAIAEVETAAVGANEARALVDELDVARNAARTAVDLADERYRAGVRSMFELVEAQQRLVALDDAWLVARQEALADIVRLYRALGGGWMTDEAAEPIAAAPEERGEQP